MRGQITQRSPGSWTIQTSAGFDDTGKRIQITRTVRGAEAQAQKALTRLLREVDEGTVARAGADNFDSYLTSVGFLICARGWYRDVAALRRARARPDHQDFITLSFEDGSKPSFRYDEAPASYRTRRGGIRLLLRGMRKLTLYGTDETLHLRIIGHHIAANAGYVLSAKGFRSESRDATLAASRPRPERDAPGKLGTGSCRSSWVNATR
jgi:hypothetical protein